MIIGLSGYAQSGKDTAAAALAPYGWERAAFADKLKSLAYRLNPPVDSLVHDGMVGLQTVVDVEGWEAAKKNPQVRGYLQSLGVTIREELGTEAWVDALFNGLQTHENHYVAEAKYVITDVRFPNEAARVESSGGYLVRIDRPGVGAVNGHISERALADWPFEATVINDGTPEDLAQKILAVVNGPTNRD